MDAKTDTLIPADMLVREGPIRVPGQSADYRAARTALLAEEIELRRYIERVAAQRRALPPGARSGPAVDRARHDAGRPRPRLVIEPDLRLRLKSA
jgi:hypothetical protein